MADKVVQQTTRDPECLKQLSTRSRFYLFAHDFLDGRSPFPFETTNLSGQRVFRLKLRQAAEFLSKKDYLDNWRSEMNEEFCFWSFAKWKSVLAEIGFEIQENPNRAEESSRAYTNPWVVQHRYDHHVILFEPSGQRLPWPPTNMVLLAVKARS